MASARFDPDTQSLLEPVTVGELKFRSIRTGELFPATDDDTLLASNNEGRVDIMSKYKNTIRFTPFEPSNPRSRTPCPKCKREITSFQRLGPEKKTIHICMCGNSFH